MPLFAGALAKIHEQAPAIGEGLVDKPPNIHINFTPSPEKEEAVPKVSNNLLKTPSLKLNLTGLSPSSKKKNQTLMNPVSTNDYQAETIKT